jgi:hypothetical protein
MKDYSDVQYLTDEREKSFGKSGLQCYTAYTVHASQVGCSTSGFQFYCLPSLAVLYY